MPRDWRFAHDEYLDQVENKLEAARTFLASIASAQPQGTVEQSEWMIAQAREGLSRASGEASPDA